MINRPLYFLICFSLCCDVVHADEPLTTAKVMASLEESDWRQPDPGNVMVMQLQSGEVIFELAPGFAPNTVANIKTLVRDGYFDGLAIIRSHDNYVAQWGDPAEEEAQQRPLGKAAESISPEFERPSEDVTIIEIESRDAYADKVGFLDGFPAASDNKHTWLTHCYGALAVARGMAPESGNGSSLYVVTGHAPRHLDRNLTVVGRALSGMEHLSALPRGTGPLGFYESPDEYVAIVNAQMADEIPAATRQRIDILRTDTDAFQQYVESRAHRREEFWVHPTGRVGLCNIHPPVRITRP
tara:strand:- start:6140 stop:7033 length:894 start_codon:yes stop_codon:yes gene_type:complete